VNFAYLPRHAPVRWVRNKLGVEVCRLSQPERRCDHPSGIVVSVVAVITVGSQHAAGTLTDIPGIGDAIADIITKLYQTGSHPSLEKLRKEVPEGVLELFAIPGIRPDKILKLHQELGITSLVELEAAAKEDRIRKTKSLGASLQTKILQNLSEKRSSICTKLPHFLSMQSRQ